MRKAILHDFLKLENWKTNKSPDSPKNIIYIQIKNSNLTGSALMNQDRLAGGLLCQEVQMALILSPTS